MDGLDLMWDQRVSPPVGIELSTEVEWVAYKRNLVKRKVRNL